ncbi:hypothetical protein TSOC_013630 [Tetrabaena socialis]|uniref:Uncharacterized protein n=1 Tax=Tetrabaena socialis TaxID=47790 RepID=A0A2J7ZJU9_9CHLO|nr:hypothetical protein TSOC_013630 [Tetrabaena socialis]|eukprot:PNH00544.1 hypothetical protein TSOC_013630 [Tetrabaena socialis]
MPWLRAVVSHSSASLTDGALTASSSTGGVPVSSGGCSAAPASGRCGTLAQELSYPGERDQPHYLANLEAAAAAGSADPADADPDGAAGPALSLARALRSSLQQQLCMANSSGATASGGGGGTGCTAKGASPGDAGNVTGIVSKLTGGSPTEAVPLSTAASAVPLGLHSALPMAVLKELKYLQINSSSGAQLSLFVLAVANAGAL